MSFPPLVCSTPPPLEQIECDEIANDDFAIPYELSQEDEEFSQYADFQSTPHVSSYGMIETVNADDKICHPFPSDVSESCQTDQNAECDTECVKTYIDNNKVKLDEDNNIEDLDLKFEHVSNKQNKNSVCENVTSNSDNPSLPTQANNLKNEESHSLEEILSNNLTTEYKHTQSIIISENILSDAPEYTENRKKTSSGHDSSTENHYETEINKPCSDNQTKNEDSSTEKEIFTDLNLISSEINLEKEVLEDLRFQNNISLAVNDEIENGHAVLEEDFDTFQFRKTQNESLTDIGHDNIGLSANNEIENVKPVLDENADDFEAFKFSETEHDTLSNIEVQNNIKLSDNENIIIEPVLDNDDDFEDFDAFQFSDMKAETPDSAVNKILGDTDSNPWNFSNDTANDFGDFKATFNEENNPREDSVGKTLENDDDFGDFDDFQSSHNIDQPPANASPAIIQSAESTFQTINFNITDNVVQLYDSIEKTIHGLYEAEAPKEGSVESNLESSLSVTWDHLTETEVRQPYMVHWNNSISQKALLKALCIDSRNILFGPKWSNMPRYAVNLGASPLQPVKQMTPSSNHPVDIVDGEKPKSIESWTDSQSGEHAEFTYAEALLLDLEHLMATLDQMSQNQSSLKISQLLSHACNESEPSNKKESVGDSGATAYQDQILKPTNIFQSTIPSQTIRQINLPDTHIFTPTDSEVPRSKTIHYDNFNPLCNTQTPVNIPQDVEGRMKNKFDDVTQDAFPTADDNFDDFQDFQGTSQPNLPNLNMSPTDPTQIQQADIVKSETINERQQTVPGVTYQMQTILEPIKLEQTVPTLNWPEPGEVKETFDDFSEFVSSSSWSGLHSTDSQINSTVHATKNDTATSSQSELSFSSATSTDAVHSIKSAESVDDDFDNFQFVPMNTEIATLEQKPEPDPIVNIKRVQSTSFVNTSLNGCLQPMKPFQMPSTSIPVNSASMPGSHSQISQPVPHEKPITTPEKSVAQQILQPLSLENISQINWPNPGMDLQDLSRFNPLNAVHSLHNSPNKQSSPAKNQMDDDGWGDFVSIKPSKSVQLTSKQSDDDDWSDFVSNVTPKQNGVNTISFNVHANSSHKASTPVKTQQDDPRIAVPTLSYVTLKTNQKVVNENQFQNL